jgi:hypothetical protein
MEKEIEDLKKACMLLQDQINALKTLVADLYKNKEDKKSKIIKPSYKN